MRKNVVRQFVLFVIIIFISFVGSINLIAQDSPDAISCSYTVDGSSLANGYKIWKTLGILYNNRITFDLSKLQAVLHLQITSEQFFNFKSTNN